MNQFHVHMLDELKKFIDNVVLSLVRMKFDGEEFDGNYIEKIVRASDWWKETEKRKREFAFSALINHTFFKFGPLRHVIGMREHTPAIVLRLLKDHIEHQTNFNKPHKFNLKTRSGHYLELSDIDAGRHTSDISSDDLAFFATRREAEACLARFNLEYLKIGIVPPRIDVVAYTRAGFEVNLNLINHHDGDWSVTPDDYI
jgi:hypothetical protein